VTYGDNLGFCNVGHAGVGVAKHTINPRTNPEFPPLLPPCLPLPVSLAIVSPKGMDKVRQNLVLSALTSAASSSSLSSSPYTVTTA